MNAILTHFRIRFRATVTDPWAAIMLIGACLPCMLIWPGPSQASGEGWLGYEAAGPFLVLCFMLGWPHFVASIPGGFDAGGKTGGIGGIHPMPTLPVGVRGRVFAEALIPLVIVLVIRIPGVFVIDWACAALDLPRQAIGDLAFWPRFAGNSLLGAVMMLPVLVVTASPVRNVQTTLAKPLVWLAMIFVALKLGFLSTTIGCMLVGVVLSGIALLTVGRKLPARCVDACWPFLLLAGILVMMKLQGVLDAAIILVLFCVFLSGLGLLGVGRLAATRDEERPLGRSETWRRAARYPESQLRRDQWLLPLIEYWRVILLAVSLQIAVVLLNHWGALPEGPLRSSKSISVMLLLIVAIQPVGKVGSLILSGFSAGEGYRCGDFAAAWSVLPVRQNAVLRGVYLHVLITGTAAWVLVLAANYWSGWLETGQFCLVDQRHEPIGWVMLPPLALILCLAGFTTAAAVGDVTGLILSAAAAVALLPLWMIFSFGQTADLPADPLTLTWLIAAATIGGGRPLVFGWDPLANSHGAD